MMEDQVRNSVFMLLAEIHGGLISNSNTNDMITHIEEAIAIIKKIRAEAEIASDNLKNITNQRDEARRELCHAMCMDALYSYKGKTPVEIAYYQEWDCFLDHADY